MSALGNRDHPMTHKKHRAASQSQRAAALIEHALVIALVAVVGIGAVSALGNTLSLRFQNAAVGVKQAGGGAVQCQTNDPWCTQ